MEVVLCILIQMLMVLILIRNLIRKKSLILISIRNITNKRIIIFDVKVGTDNSNVSKTHKIPFFARYYNINEVKIVDILLIKDEF